MFSFTFLFFSSFFASFHFLLYRKYRAPLLERVFLYLRRAPGAFSSPLVHAEPVADSPAYSVEALIDEEPYCCDKKHSDYQDTQGSISVDYILAY